MASPIGWLATMDVDCPEAMAAVQTRTPQATESLTAEDRPRRKLRVEPARSTVDRIRGERQREIAKESREGVGMAEEQGGEENRRERLTVGPVGEGQNGIGPREIKPKKRCRVKRSHGRLPGVRPAPVVAEK